MISNYKAGWYFSDTNDMGSSDAVIDSEILDAFVVEINQIQGDLAIIFMALHEDYKQPRLFERYGQIIDRIYGTAATLGFKEVADYTRVLKTICYKCSQSDNIYAMGRVKDLMFVYLENLERLAKTIHEPKMVRQLRMVFAAEIEKANSLSKTIFGAISRGSVD